MIDLACAGAKLLTAGNCIPGAFRKSWYGDSADRGNALVLLIRFTQLTGAGDCSGESERRDTNWSRHVPVYCGYSGALGIHASGYKACA